MSFDCVVRAEDWSVLLTVPAHTMRHVHANLTSVPAEMKDARAAVSALLTGSCCYAIYSPETNSVKIGRSNDVLGRRTALMTGTSCKLYIVGVWRTHDPAQLEKHLHSTLDEYRLYGEWFIAAGALPLLSSLPEPQRSVDNNMSLLHRYDGTLKIAATTEAEQIEDDIKFIVQKLTASAGLTRKDLQNKLPKARRVPKRLNTALNEAVDNGHVRIDGFNRFFAVHGGNIVDPNNAFVYSDKVRPMTEVSKVRTAETDPDTAAAWAAESAS